MVFEIFRRRQKQMIALLAVLAMFAFVLSSFLMRSIDRTDRYVDRQVATAWGEPIMASQIEGMQRDRFVANQFFMLALDRVSSKQRPPQWSTEADVVIPALVVLEKARQLGLSVEDAEVTQFIAERTENKLSPGAFHAVLAELGRSAISDRELYSIIARELLFDKAISILASPVARDTPLEHWENRLPALTHVQVELVRLPIPKFVDSKASPAPQEIEKLFAAHKDRVANPEQGIIGFKEPHRVELQYLVADVTKLAEKVSVSEAEVKQYYEQHKEEFKETAAAPQPEPPVPPPPTKPADKDSKPDAKTPAASKTEPMPKPAADAPKPATKPAEPAKAAPTKDQPSTKTTESKAKPAAKPAESQEKPAKPSQGKANANSKDAIGEKPAENKAKPAESKEKPAAKAPAKAGASIAPSLLTEIAATGLVMLQESKPGEKAAAPSGKPVEKSATADKPAAAEKAEAKPAEKREPKAVEKPDTGKAAAEKPALAPAKTAPATAKAASEQPPPPAYKPFEAVRLEITQRLNREKAGKQAADQLRNLLRTVMYEYLDAYGAAKRKFRYENPNAVEEDGELAGFVPPPLPDLKAIGEPLGLEFKTTGMVTEKELTDSPIGSIVQVDDTVGASSFVHTAFSQDLYWGRVYQDLDGARYYLCWKVKNRPASVPELAKVREQVVAAWRLEQARPKAKENAEKLAEEIKKAGGAFEKGLPKDGGYTIERTALFSRKIRRFSSFPFLEQNQYDEPNIPEIPNAGAELLDAVFKAPKGEVFVKADARQQNYYIMKVVERADPDFQQFVTDYDNEQRLMRAPGSFGQVLEMQRQFRVTVEAICKEAGLEIKPTEEQPPTTPDSAPAG